jgi:DNA-binding transcriptional regulator YiaG
MSIFPTIHVSLLNESQIAETLGVSVATIRRWRLQRRGPRFLNSHRLKAVGWIPTESRFAAEAA